MSKFVKCTLKEAIATHKPDDYIVIKMLGVRRAFPYKVSSIVEPMLSYKVRMIHEDIEHTSIRGITNMYILIRPVK